MNTWFAKFFQCSETTNYNLYQSNRLKEASGVTIWVNREKHLLKPSAKS